MEASLETSGDATVSVKSACERPADMSDVARQRRGKRLQLSRPLPPRPSRSSMERACRIALMEGDDPVTVEALYDRITRRGALGFLGYKQPFRAIALAMSSLVKSGEAILFLKNGPSNVSRRSRPCSWQRAFSRPDIGYPMAAGINFHRISESQPNRTVTGHESDDRRGFRKEREASSQGLGQLQSEHGASGIRSQKFVETNAGR
jgi:hypothetical protein